MNSRKYSVYALTCGGEIRYIGITSQSLGRRLSQHLSDAKRASRNEHKTNWIRKCLKDGDSVQIKLLRQWMDESDAHRIERQIIAKLRPQLVNVHEGGTSGYNGLSDDAKARHLAAMRHAAETRDFTSFHEAGRAAKERLRMERHANEPIRVEWRGRLEQTWTWYNHTTKEVHVLDLYRGRRRDQFDATVDGKPWRKGLSATAISGYIRRKLKAHIGPL